jgi:hypothetical protein
MALADHPLVPVAMAVPAVPTTTDTTVTPDTTATPDTADVTAKSVAKVFFIALSQGDVERALTCVDPDDRERLRELLTRPGAIPPLPDQPTVEVRELPAAQDEPSRALAAVTDTELWMPMWRRDGTWWVIHPVRQR